MKNLLNVNKKKDILSEYPATFECASVEMLENKMV